MTSGPSPPPSTGVSPVHPPAGVGAAPATSEAWLRRMAPWVAAGLLAGALLLAYLGKAVCLDGETGFLGRTRYCYSDVRVLWSFRGFDVDAVPYAGPPPGYPVAYSFEYPPGMAFPAWLIALATDSRRGFFNLHAVSFAVAAFVALAGLDRALTTRVDGRPGPQAVPRGPVAGRSRWRLLGLALSPGLVLFGMQNWDLWVVAVVALGLGAAARGHPWAAAVSFGVGAAVKWWPALLVVVLLTGPWAPAARTDGRWPRHLPGISLDLRPALVAAATWAAWQLPALAVSPTGWWQALSFHLQRSANYDSTAAAIANVGQTLAPGWFWSAPYTTIYTVVSLSLLVAGAGYVIYRLGRHTLAPADATLALVALFLFTGKVFSPQFVLWLLPVAVVATVSWTPVLAVEASNAAVWLLYAPWLGNFDQQGFAGFLEAAQGLSVVRSLAVAWLVAAALWPPHHRPGGGVAREPGPEAAAGSTRPTQRGRKAPTRSSASPATPATRRVSPTPAYQA